MYCWKLKYVPRAFIFIVAGPLTGGKRSRGPVTQGTCFEPSVARRIVVSEMLVMMPPFELDVRLDRPLILLL